MQITSVKKETNAIIGTMVRTFVGTNDFALTKALKDVITQFQDQHGNSIERYDAAEVQSIDAVIDAVRSLSFLDPIKMVIVKNFSDNKDLLEKLDSIVESTADSTHLVLVARQIDKRSKTYSYLKDKTDFSEFNNLEEQEIIHWLVQEAANASGTLTPVDARYMVELLGTNQQLLHQELTKLLILSPRITRETITELIEPTPQSKVFSMLEALFSGDLKRTQKLYEDQRSQGEEPQKMIGMIIWQLEQLAFAVFAPSRSVEVLARAGLSSYSARKAIELARTMDKTKLKKYVAELTEIDALSKTTADVESALAVYFTSVARG